MVFGDTTQLKMYCRFHNFVLLCYRKKIITPFFLISFLVCCRAMVVGCHSTEEHIGAWCDDWENDVNDSIIDRRRFHELPTCVCICL
ncbi:hypothetical protein EYC80_004759 [Monilinia laxa]|uniref:Uncharacterized protein n=1 Tax=Monilinia laxa TaxID=61186 RepID=A0A5N6KHZ1_MONLA|nr:hypothetical protein EYC80_004759 [Monilinia laxa]